MSKINLNEITTGYAAITVYNENNQIISDGLDNTLSRDGTGPNQMGAALDMNSNRIVNVAAPVDATDAVRLTDLIGTAINVQLYAGAGDFNTITAAASLVGVGALYLRTSGYTVAGDGGGALYSQASGSTPGGFQAGNGQWYQLCAPYASEARCYGAKGDGVTDDSAALNAWLQSGVRGLTLSAANNGAEAYLINSSLTWTNPTNAFESVLYCSGKIKAGASFPVGHFMFIVNSGGLSTYNLSLDGGKNGLGSNYAYGGVNSIFGFQNRFYSTFIEHCYGVCFNLPVSGGGDQSIIGGYIQQWSGGDTEISTQANYTADGIRVDHPDNSIIECVVRYCGIPLHCTGNAGTTWVKGCHLYNGGAGAGSVFVDAKIVQLDLGANGIFFNSCYLDEGLFIANSSSFYITNCSVLQAGTVTCFTNPCMIQVYADGLSRPRFHDIDLTTNGLSTTNINPTSLIDSGPTQLIGYFPTAAVPIFVSAATGTQVTYTSGTPGSPVSWPIVTPGSGSQFVPAAFGTSGYNTAATVVSSTSTTVVVNNTTTGSINSTGTGQVAFGGSYAQVPGLVTSGQTTKVRTNNGEIHVYVSPNTTFPTRATVSPVTPITYTYNVNNGTTVTETYTSAGTKTTNAPIVAFANPAGVGNQTVLKLGTGTTDDFALITNGSGTGSIRVQNTTVLDFDSINEVVPHIAAFNLGSSAKPFQSGWIKNAWNLTSDIRFKYVRPEHVPGLEFWDGLDEISFTWANDPDGPLHYGHSAQQVREVLDTLGVKSHAMHTDGDVQSIAREEWWAIASKSFKELKAQIGTLQEQVRGLADEVTLLRSR